MVVKVKVKFDTNKSIKKLGETIPKEVHSKLSAYVEDGEASKQLIQCVDPLVPVVTGRLRASAKWRWTNRHKYSRLQNKVTYNPLNPKSGDYYAQWVEEGGSKNIPRWYMYNGILYFEKIYRQNIIKRVKESIRQGD